MYKKRIQCIPFRRDDSKVNRKKSWLMLVYPILPESSEQICWETKAFPVVTSWDRAEFLSLK